MIKKYSKLFIGALALLIAPTMVQADHSITCDNRTYTVSYTNNTANVGGIYTMRFYNTTSAGISNIKTYCMSPGKVGGNYIGSGKTYVCDRVIDPSGGTSDGNLRVQAFDVAVTKAYQILLADGHTTTSNDDRIIGELLFRWLSFNFGQGDSGINYSSGGSSVRLFSDMTADGMPKKWIGNSDSRVQYALSVYQTAKAAGDEIIAGKLYQDLVPSGPGDTSLIWGDTYNYIVNMTMNGANEVYTIQLDATNTDAPSNIYWNLFKGGCKNSTVKCTSTASGSGMKGTVTITVYKTANYDGKDYELYFDSNYYDVRSAGSNILLTKPTSKVYSTNQGWVEPQKMLIAVDGSISITHDGGPHSATRHPVYTNRCERQSDGTYDYISYKNGNETSRVEVTNEEDMVKYACPVYCQLFPDSTRTDEHYGWADQAHFGTADNGNKHYFNKSDYQKYCDAPTPTGPTCKHENGKYYGKNGNEVDKDTFYNECCDQIDPSSEEYQYCSCGEPDISFIGACTEFNSDNEVLNNHVNDIKQDAAVKYCLFNANNKDKAGNSYEMTDQSTVVNNPYCKVSCVEEYKFELPNAKYTMSGSYFELETSVQGTRKCYVNAQDNFNGINYNKFKADLEAKRKEIIDAYNDYYYWVVASETELHSEQKTAAQGTCTSSCTVNGKPDTCTSPGKGPEKYTYVWMKWSATQRSYDGGYKANRDGDYSDGSGSCGCESCHTEDGEDPRDGYRANRDSALATLNTKIAEYNQILQNYNNCSGVITTTSSNSISFPGITSSGWENNFEFDPKIEFEYDEPYQNMNGFNNIFEKVETTADTSSENYCTDEVGSTYKCNGSSSITTQNETYFLCTSSGCSNVSMKIGSAKYIIKSKTEGATYKPKNNFSIYTPAGTIALDKGNYVLYTNLCDGSGACLPIALNTTTGVFNFKFKYSQIGQFNDTNVNGRLVGESKSIYSSVANQQQAGYVCHYINNCPGCDYVCVGDNCEITGDPDYPCIGEECTYVCENCIFDGTDHTFYYRTVSINKLFPNSRTYGPNWTNDKGKYTKQIIEESGEETYKEPEYSYTISPQQMNRIREYNKDVGGYLNTKMPNGDDSLVCHDMSSNGKNYSNIYCISSFLDTAGNTYFTENKRNDVWTLWPDSGFYTKGTNYAVTIGVGPSWK